MSDPADLLAEVGVPADLAAAYVDLVERPDGRPDDHLLPRLQELGLVRVDGDGDVHPLPPRWAVGALVRGRREALLVEDDRLRATVLAAEDMQVQYERAQERRGEAPLIEVLHGDRAADATVDQLAATCTRSLDAFQPGPTRGRPHQAKREDLDAMARGVRSRCIYSPTFLAEEGALDMVRELAAHGEEVRVHSGMPSPMLVFDEEVVVLPTDRSGHPSRGAAIVRSSSVVEACSALFEAVWREATRLDVGPSGRHHAGDPDADRIPSLLLAGFADERIARELDVSVRTVRRRVRELMDHHGAATRVQLGAALARRGQRMS